MSKTWTIWKVKSKNQNPTSSTSKRATSKMEGYASSNRVTWLYRKGADF